MILCRFLSAFILSKFIQIPTSLNSESSHNISYTTVFAVPRFPPFFVLRFYNLLPCIIPNVNRKNKNGRGLGRWYCMQLSDHPVLLATVCILQVFKNWMMGSVNKALHEGAILHKEGAAQVF